MGITEAANYLVITPQTLRRWEREGIIFATEHTKGGQLRYNLEKLKSVHSKTPNEKKTIAYARVSSHDQKSDLERQCQLLELYCSKHGWSFEIISDLVLV